MKRYGFLAAFIMMFFLLGSSVLVYGAGENSLSIPVSISWGEGGLQPEKTYQLILEGTEGGEPVPAGAGERYTIELDKNSQISEIPRILYETPGEYSYILKLVREDGRETGRYYIHVTASYGAGEQLKVTCSIHKNSIQGEKTDRILFVDSAEKTPQITPTSEPSAPEASKVSGNDTVKGKAGKVKTGDETKILFYLVWGTGAMLFILAAGKRKYKS